MIATIHRGLCHMRSEHMDLAELAVDYAKRVGADYAEARLHRTFVRSLLLKNGEPEPIELEDAYGVGVRVLLDGALAFAASNVLTRLGVRRAVEGAVKRAQASQPLLRRPVRFSAEKAPRRRWATEQKKRLENVNVEEVFRLLRDIDTSLREDEVAVKLTHRLIEVNLRIDTSYFVNSEGARVQGLVPRVHYSHILTAVEGGQSAQRILQLGESAGWEAVRHLKPLEAAVRDAKVLGEILRKAAPPPKGVIDVIMGPELAGIVAHESVGHPVESDRILGREGAQAGESYLKPADHGLRVGGPEASVSDDPTLPRSYGYYLYDDEGVEARRRRLMEAGVINEYLYNRSSAAEFGVNSNGAARANRFDREPIVRMGNTYVEPGDYSLDEMVEDVELGVYFKSFQEWNIDDKRFNQRYVGLEAYLIEKGELKELVKEPVLEITTPRLWKSVDVRGRDLQFFAASCGKGDPMQPIPVWTGGPHFRLRGVQLGTR